MGGRAIGIAALALAVALAVAALVGWRGSRPTVPVVATRSDGVTVVPATGSPRFERARPADPVATPVPPAQPTPAGTDPDAVAMIRDLDAVAADFDRQRRDPAWSPGAEAGLRNAFAGIAGIGTPIAAECRASLCRIGAAIPAGPRRDEADLAIAALQARLAAQTRASAPFTANNVRVVQLDESGEAVFTAYLLRR